MWKKEGKIKYTRILLLYEKKHRKEKPETKEIGYVGAGGGGDVTVVPFGKF